MLLIVFSAVLSIVSFNSGATNRKEARVLERGVPRGIVKYFVITSRVSPNPQSGV